MTEEYLTQRAERGSRAKFDAAMRKVPKALPVPGDELPPGYRARIKQKGRATSR